MCGVHCSIGDRKPSYQLNQPDKAVKKTRAVVPWANPFKVFSFCTVCRGWGGRGDDHMTIT